MEHDERRRADVLDRYWDATQREESGRRPADFDEVTAAIVDHLGKSPAPPDTNAAQLRVRQRIVAAANELEEMMHASSSPHLGTGRIPHSPWMQSRPVTSHRHHVFARVALAALLVVALAAGNARFGPSGADDRPPASIPALVLATEAAAPDTARAEAPLLSTSGHPVVGVWQLDNDPTNPGTDISWVVFDEVGRFNEIDGLMRVNIGTWQAPGERVADVVFKIQDVTRQYRTTPDDPPQPNALSLEMEVWRVTVTVDESGDSMTLVGHWDAYDASGVIVNSEDYEGTGTRMQVVSPTGDAMASP